MSTTIATATTNINKKRRAGQDLADVDHTKEEAVSEMNRWRETLTMWLALNGARTLGSVVDLPTLFPDLSPIAGVRVRMLNVDVVLQLIMVIYKDEGPPMSFDVYQTLRASYSAVCRYALALSSVVASDTIALAAVATEAAKKAKDDERYSRVVLLRNIARELVPGFVQSDVEFVLEGEELRRVDRAFLAWPVRYATPSSVYYAPADEEHESPASIGFWLEIGPFEDVEMVTFDIQHDDDDTYSFVAQDEQDQALLQRVDGEE
jgi:hypothetical protein